MAEIRVVAGAIVQAGRVLAARRAPGMSQAGLWELPGGKVEAGERDRAALARELEEELALSVDVGALLGESVHAYPQITVRLVAYACEAPGGVPVAREHDALRWLGPDELDDVAWAPADVPLLAPTRAWLLRG